jgi:hypothetical protein
MILPVSIARAAKPIKAVIDNATTTATAPDWRTRAEDTRSGLSRFIAPDLLRWR